MHTLTAKQTKTAPAVILLGITHHQTKTNITSEEESTTLKSRIGGNGIS